MKTCSRFFIVFIVIFALCFPAFAAENRKKEMTDSVNAAAKLLETKGKVGIEELKSFRFAGGEGYVYLTNMDFIVIMHPVAKELVGRTAPP